MHATSIRPDLMWRRCAGLVLAVAAGGCSGQRHDVALVQLHAAPQASPPPPPAVPAATAATAPLAPVVATPAVPELPRSSALKNARLCSPLPGGQFAGYAGDTGLDIAGRSLTVFAVAAGTIEYSEHGHTVWTGGGDTPNSVRVRLDVPIVVERYGKAAPAITHMYYTHLAKLRFGVAEGQTDNALHVDCGEALGISGIGNGLPHLHLGLLLGNDTSQTSWANILREDEVRSALGGYKNLEKLPLLGAGDAQAVRNYFDKLPTIK
jgi:murein DD-endopeptidase MepM/ murein hydrolase activator NlpD